jgi:hypothetical protein
MKSTIVWFLAGLNLLLAAILIVRFVPATTAHAQVPRPSDYLMVPGSASGLPYSIVYVIDTTNGVLGGMAWNESNRQMATMAPYDLNRAFAGGGKGTGNTRAPYHQ